MPHNQPLFAFLALLLILNAAFLEWILRQANMRRLLDLWRRMGVRVMDLATLNRATRWCVRGLAAMLLVAAPLLFVAGYEALLMLMGGVLTVVLIYLGTLLTLVLRGRQ